MSPEDEHVTVSATSFDAAGLTWKARSEHADAVRAVAERIHDIDDSTLVKRSLFREVHRLDLTGDDGPRVIVKQHIVRGTQEAVKYILWHSRARTEWDVSLKLEELGVPVAKTLGFGESRRAGALLHQAVSVSEEILDVEPLALAMTDPVRHDGLVDALIQLVLDMHERGVDHSDLHGGNLLATEDEKIVVIDLHAVRLRSRVSWSRRIAALGQLLWSLGAAVDSAGRARFVQRYAAELGLYSHDAGKLLDRVERWIARYESRRFKSRTRRCIINSSRFCIDKPRGRCIHRRRIISARNVSELITAHREAVEAGSSAVLKRDRRSSLTRQKLGGEEVCVKEFTSRGPRDRLVMRLWRSRAKLAWIAANGLIARGVPTPEPLAMLDDLRTGDSFVITRFIEGATPLDAWVAGPGVTCPPRFRRELVDKLADVVRTLHETGVYAEDLSAKNVIIRRRDDTWQAHIVDVDNTHLWQKLTRRRRLWNLAQLNDIPTGVSPAERLRFFYAYAGCGSRVLSRQDAKVIMTFSRERHKRWRRKLHKALEKGEDREA